MDGTRRTFLGAGLMILLGFARKVWAQGFGAIRYRRLSRPVLIPLADMSTPWRARTFVAEAVSLPGAERPNQPIRISGSVVRTAAVGELSDQFRAVGVLCPHEHCDVDYIADPAKLAEDVIREIGPVKDPVYLCPCHNSTFKAQDGERLGGPAPRGLYRFRVTNVSDAAIEIAEVEEDALIFTGTSSAAPAALP
jgi:Rieske Fe-S protein